MNLQMQGPGLHRTTIYVLAKSQMEEVGASQRWRNLKTLSSFPEKQVALSRRTALVIGLDKGLNQSGRLFDFSPPSTKWATALKGY